MNNHERAVKAASARWGGRGKSATIRVDADIPKLLKPFREGARKFASKAIRNAVKGTRR